ncbi:homoserine O-acetyltransferase [Microbacteriaceae bacterium K1510]|jgi:homoserine O-acetyltransferase|uniref:homoserine O-acetyltransferase MetX n=1 Tax=Microbacterium sp. 4NA327F11 TaxID=2502229 RepID=UPI0010F6034E|nr:homoserine O-acetyltransferase [Microbacterium sp. 4NA327F11]MBN9209152.1 homoserine O-acetyltransferase [Microbacterium ginsengisoli]MCK9914902.1 homoserine O-acetyltransferase [Microbacteriaceae bacterium K1510]
MDWQTSEDTVPSAPVSEADARRLGGRPPATGAWRDGDPAGDRRFAAFGAFTTEGGATLPAYRLAFETWGELSPARDNAVLVLHALTGDSHVRGEGGPGHPTDGWWGDIVGPGAPIDTDRWFVIAPNMLGGCQGSTGAASIGPRGAEWGARFPYLTIRDQVEAQLRLVDALGIERFAGVIGGSMGGMHALEWAISHPERVARLGVLAAPPIVTADQVALNSAQLAAIRLDPGFEGGDYYDAAAGEGPHRGLALARRMALLNYRSPEELNLRFQRSWQSDVSPLGHGGRFAVESYLDFHGNKFTRRFDANAYVTLVEAMNSHDVGRDRGGVEEALRRITATTLVLGIDSDRLFPVDGQHRIARSIPRTLDGDRAVVISSDFGHDGFLIESDEVGGHLRRLLDAPAG